ncbi:hypothetical protein NKR23_g11975 [Pleurostoma richardsiae]|uniref:Uncharacterized protein n=1 Tax=Pleurostoma richardsiae TaxID=41990 RepID=A0AA38R8V5_9PEZI|nr:hypothetical protein NKR23_g11975 [Pleurostoma richardsiae]
MSTSTPQAINDREWATELARALRGTDAQMKWIAENRTPLSKDDLLAMLPGPDPVKRWVEAYDLAKSNNQAVSLWKAVPRLLRCLPTDIISSEHRLEFDASRNPIVPGQGFINPLWSTRFCDALRQLALHPEFEPGENLGLLIVLIQYTVICHTNDCRYWDFTNTTTDRFLDELAAEAGTEDEHTIVERHDRASETLQGRRQSRYSRLMRAIEKRYFKGDAPKRTGVPATPASPFKVKSDDLEALRDCIGVLGAAWPAGTWSVSPEMWSNIMNKRTKDRINSDLPDIPLLKRMLLHTMLSMKRDDMAAQRRAQAPAAVAQPSDDWGADVAHQGLLPPQPEPEPEAGAIQPRQGSTEGEGEDPRDNHSASPPSLSEAGMALSGDDDPGYLAGQGFSAGSGRSSPRGALDDLMRQGTPGPPDVEGPYE